MPENKRIRMAVGHENYAKTGHSSRFTYILSGFAHKKDVSCYT